MATSKKDPGKKAAPPMATEAERATTRKAPAKQRTGKDGSVEGFMHMAAGTQDAMKTVAVREAAAAPKPAKKAPAKKAASSVPKPAPPKRAS